MIASKHAEIRWSSFDWRGDRAVEGARLEIVCTPNKGTGGSNPPLSAMVGVLSEAGVGQMGIPRRLMWLSTEAKTVGMSIADS
jgi:hypothetical protein